jgi:hypothetical protein
MPMVDRLAIRKRLLNDFEFYAKHCVKIRTKDGKIVPLVLNKVQRRFMKAVIRQLTTKGRVRMVVLKARQQGLSTVISAVQYWWVSQRKAMKGLVMSHEAESTDTLFQMYRRIHDNCPLWVKPSTKYSSKTEMVFDKLDSAFRVATAGGRGVARGDTIQFAHLSEVAFWPTTFAQANFNGLIQAVPENDGTFVFVESTAQGVTGKFADLWNNAVEMGYEQFFSAWFESDEYRAAAPADFERTPDEEDLIKLFGCEGLVSNDQLFWRRRKVAANGLDLFRQEYPGTPEEAFISTGRPVFNPDTILQRLHSPKKPLKLMAVEEGALNEHPRGELKVYVDYPDVDADGRPTGRRSMVSPDQNYVIGADVGMGVRDGDYSVAQVLDGDLRQVAVWRGIIHPDQFAKIIMALGYYYNTALVAPERNNHGLLTCVRLRDLGYPNIYTDTTEGTLEDKDTIRIGFYTDERTKPLIIDKLRAVDRDRQIEINDEQTLREMYTYVITDTGKMKAEEPGHDDCVMSLALANHVHEGKWTPVSFTDDFYSNAI